MTEENNKTNNENHFGLRLQPDEWALLRAVNYFYVHTLETNKNFSEIVREGFKKYWSWKLKKLKAEQKQNG